MKNAMLFTLLLLSYVSTHGQNKILHSVKIENENWRYKQVSLGVDGFVLAGYDFSSKVPTIEIRKYDTALVCQFQKVFNLPKKYSSRAIDYNKNSSSVYFLNWNKNKFWINALNLENSNSQMFEGVFEEVSNIDQNFIINHFLYVPVVEKNRLIFKIFDIEKSIFQAQNIDLDIEVKTIDKVEKLQGYENFFMTINENFVIEFDQNLIKQRIFCLKDYGDNMRLLSSDLVLNNNKQIIISGTYSENNIGKNVDGYFIKNFDTLTKNILKFDAQKIAEITKEKNNLINFSSSFQYENDFYFLCELVTKSTTTEFTTDGTRGDVKTIKTFAGSLLLKSNLDGELSIANAFINNFGIQLLNSDLIYKFTTMSTFPIFFTTNKTEFVSFNHFNKKAEFRDVSIFFKDYDYTSLQPKYSSAMHIYDNVFLTYHHNYIDYKDVNDAKLKTKIHLFNLIQVK